METRIITIISVLALNVSISMANPIISFSEIRASERSVVSLAPVAPAEAEFNDLAPEANASMVYLIPVTPKEATFEEEIITDSRQDEASLTTLSPTTPKEADFEESI